MSLTLRYTWLECKMFVRNGALLFFTGLFPIFFFALWATLNMGGNVDFVVRWLTPAAITWTIMSNTIMNISITVPIHRDQKILKRLKGTPFPGWVYLVAKAVLMFGLVAIQSTVIFILSALMLKPMQPNWGLIALAIAAGTILFGVIALGLANLIPTGDSAPGIANAIYFPMLFLSGSFFPIESIPKVVQILAAVNPATYLLELLRHLFAGEPAAPTQTYGWAVVAVWFGVGLYFAVTRFRWESTR
jgi:ABC-2 type transport system permease protein